MFCRTCPCFLEFQSSFHFRYQTESARWLLTRDKRAKAMDCLVLIAKRNGRVIPPDVVPIVQVRSQPFRASCSPASTPVFPTSSKLLSHSASERISYHFRPSAVCVAFNPESDLGAVLSLVS